MRLQPTQKAARLKRPVRPMSRLYELYERISFMKKRTFVILVVIIFLCILGNVTSFAQSIDVSNHPYKLFFERRVSQFDEFNIPPNAIVFLGDSLIDEGRWDEMFPNFKIVNRGILADRTEHVISRIIQITKWQPSKIFLMIGTNDLKFGVKQKIILSNYEKILELIKKDAPKTEIFVQSLLPRESKFRKPIEHINKELMILANRTGCVYIDLYPFFLDKNGSLKKEYSNDGLHLLGTGYLKWKQLIEPYIQ